MRNNGILRVLKLLIISPAVFFGSCAKEEIIELHNPISGFVLFGAQSDLDFVESPNNFVKDNDRGAILSSSVENPSSGGRTGVSHLVVPYELEEKARGKKVIVSIIVSTTEKDSSEEFAVAYSTNMNGNSGWNKFIVKPGSNLYEFEYSVPPSNKPENYDYIGVNADTAAKGKSILVEQVSLKFKDHKN